MTKPLDELLNDLSLRARHAEDAIGAVRRETHDGVVARREEFRAAAAAAADRVERDLQLVGTRLEGDWTALRRKGTSDLARLKSHVPDRQASLSSSRLVDRVARRESEACVAIDFAFAAIESAKLAVLEAVIADREASAARDRPSQNMRAIFPRIGSD